MVKFKLEFNISLLEALILEAVGKIVNQKLFAKTLQFLWAPNK